MNGRKLQKLTTTLCAAAVLSSVAIAASDSGSEGIPAGAEVLLIGSPELSGKGLGGRGATLAMGATDKSGPLPLGAAIEPRALQTVTFETLTEDGREILRRSTQVRRPDSDAVVASASIDMDAATLLPLVARTEQGGQTTVLEYDWERFVVTTNGDSSSEIALDLPMVEVGAHDVWMAALPLRDGFVGRVPAIFASTGTKYWAVPRVVGSEAVDLGDGTAHDAWVVELDWWGMGAHNTSDNHSVGGGPNNTAGPGGKYWVLKNPPANVPHVVRVRTEISSEMDSVVQIQGG